MKKALSLSFAAALSLTMIIAGCDKNTDRQPADYPEITLEKGEVTLNSIEFTIVSSNAEKVAYMIIKSDENIPDVSSILAEGIQVEPNTEVTETVSDLESATEYIIAAAAENGDLVTEEPATLAISTESDLFADITSEYTSFQWFGHVADTGSDLFFLQLSNAEFDESFMPTEGGELVRLYLYTSPVAEGSDPQLAPGTYKIGNEDEATPFTYDPASSVFAMGSNGNDWQQINYESGEVVVGFENGEYTITANMVIADGQGTKIRARFKGAAEILDYSDGFLHFNTDQNETMTGMTGAVTSSTVTPDLDDYTITLYNCELDKDGFIIGAGFVFNCELYAKAVPFEEYEFAGTYTSNPDWEQGIYPENTYITGFVYDMYGMKIPVGTYLSEYDDSGTLIAAGLVQDGEIIISRSDGKCKIDAVLTTSKGVSVTISYDGPDVPLANRKTDAAPEKQPVPKSRPQITATVNGWTPLG